MKLSNFLPCSFIAAAVAIAGCKQTKAPPLAATPPQVVVATVEPRDVPVIEEWIGNLDGSANVDIRVRVQGYIQEIAFKEGSVVKEGDLLLRIDPRPYEATLEQAKAELGQAIAEQEKAEQDEQRQTDLFNKKIASKQDSADREVDAKTGTIRISAIFPNPGGILRPGHTRGYGSKSRSATARFSSRNEGCWSCRAETLFGWWIMRIRFHSAK